MRSAALILIALSFSAYGITPLTEAGLAGVEVEVFERTKNPRTASVAPVAGHGETESRQTELQKPSTTERSSNDRPALWVDGGLQLNLETTFKDQTLALPGLSTSPAMGQSVVENLQFNNQTTIVVQPRQ